MALVLKAPSESSIIHPGIPRAGSRRLVDYFRLFWREFVFGIGCLVFTQAFALMVPRLLKWATDAIIAQNESSAIDAALWMVVVAVVAAIARVVSRILIFNAGRRVEHALRQDLFQHTLAQGQAFFHHMPQGQVMSRMVSDLTQVRLLLGPGLLNLTNTALVYMVVLPILFLTDWQLTLAALSVFPLLLLSGRAFAKRIYPLSVEAQERLGKISTRVQENLSGVLTVRAYGQERQEEENFRVLTEDYLSVIITLARLQGLLFPFMGLVAGLGTVIVVALAGGRIHDGTMTVGGFVEFNAYLSALIWPTIALGWMVSMLQRSRAAMNRVNDIFKATPVLYDGEATEADSVPAISNDVQFEIRGLNFSYDDAPVLRDMSFSIRQGEMVVVAGRTGSGKSTLLELLARLLPVSEEAIFFRGVDVTKLPLTAVRSKVGYAPQDTFLFSRSLAENVQFGKSSASLEDVEKALAAASFVTTDDAFPEGLQTLVGERGVTLSGGQRQRTALARALLPERDILILDDTLSAVDAETEAKILASLVGQEGGAKQRRPTVIMATHRLACAQYADRVLVLDQGQLVEQGTEEELLALGGIYADMHRRQRLREAIARSSSGSDAKVRE